MRLAIRSALAAAFTAFATLASASAPSTGASVADQETSPAVFFGLLAGVAGLGVVLWLGSKYIGKRK